MCKVSVIIAAYNVENYISETLNSVLSQTLSDIEILVVDDCSTDKTPDIIKKYAALDPRVKHIRNEVNKSAMQVRRIGVEHASGDYIMFLDGDDSYVLTACEAAYNSIRRVNVDMLQFETEIFFDDPQKANAPEEHAIRQYLASTPAKAVTIDQFGFLNKSFKGQINFTVWNKIYRANLVKKANEHVPDQYANMAEDVLFSCLIQYYARTFEAIDARLYRYRIGTGISTSTKPTERQLTAIAKNAYLYNYIKQWLSERGADRACRRILHRIHQQLFTQICYTYFHKLEEDQKNPFIEQILQFCPVEELLLAFSAYVSAGHVSAEAMAAEMKKLNLFATSKKEVRTVGVFYYRMFNGGVESVLSTLTDIWIKRGYNVVLFTDAEPNKKDFYINPLVKRVITPAIKDPNWYAQQKRIRVFRQALIENNVDIMVYNAWINPHIVLEEMIIKSCGIPLIIHTHSMFCAELNCPDSSVAYYYSALHRLLAPADSIIALNDVDVAWWKAMGCKAFKTVNPIQLPLSTQPAALEGNHVLFVGRISPEKQVLDTIRIIEQVVKEIPDAVLHIVGSGDDPNYAKRIDDYIETHKLQKAVKMEGFTTNVLPYYQQADVMLSTSMYEGFSLALTESKVCGLPLVCYFLPNWDLARAPKGMINIPQGDINAAAKAIVDILRDRDLKQRMGREARESAEELLSIDLSAHWDRIFEQTLQPTQKEDGVKILPPLETAINLAVGKYTEGIIKRGNIPGFQSGGSQYQSEQVQILVDTLKGIENSESYKLGLFLTAIPRKLKRVFKHRK